MFIRIVATRSAPRGSRRQKAKNMNRSKALDGLRGLAALAVIFYHAILHHEVLVSTVLVQPIQSLSSFRDIVTKIALMLFNGNSAVILFFVLSGFVLTLSLHRMQGSPVEILGKFMARRIFRLYPALFVCMLFYYALSVVYATLGQSGFPVPDFARAMTNATLIDITWHGPSRTIQAEMLVVPFLLTFFALYRFFGVSALFLALGYSIMAITNPAMVLWAPNMAGWLLSFAAGMLLAHPDCAQLFSKARTTGIVMMALGLIFIRAFVGGVADATVIGTTMLCMALVGSIHYGGNKAVDKALTHKIPQFLGQISFSLYLLNVPLLLVAWSITDRFGLYGTHALETGLVVGTIVSVATIPLAYIVTVKIEEPMIALGKKLTDKWSWQGIALAFKPTSQTV